MASERRRRPADGMRWRRGRPSFDGRAGGIGRGPRRSSTGWLGSTAWRHDLSWPELVLFALHTWYVLLVKLLSGTACRGPPPPFDGADLARAATVARRLALCFQAAVFTDSRHRSVVRHAVQLVWRACRRTWNGPRATRPGASPATIRGKSSPRPAGGGDLLKPLYESLFPPPSALLAGRILHARLARRTRCSTRSAISASSARRCSIRLAIRHVSAGRLARWRVGVGQDRTTSAGPP